MRNPIEDKVSFCVRFITNVILNFAYVFFLGGGVFFIGWKFAVVPLLFAPSISYWQAGAISLVIWLFLVIVSPNQNN